MGAEAPCSLSLEGKRVSGKALLETAEIIFRAPTLRLVVPFAALTSVSSADGVLHVAWAGRTAAFELGSAAAKWLEKIKNPRSRADKLGIKAGHRVALVGGSDPTLVAEVSAKGAEVTAGAPRADTDLVFLFAETRAALSKLGSLQKKLKKDGAIWVIRPRGAEAITEREVMSAGRAAGLVDVKVAAYSATHTAEKLVIPVSRR